MSAFMDMDHQLDSLLEQVHPSKPSTSKQSPNNGESQKLVQTMSQRLSNLTSYESERERQKAVNGFRSVMADDSQASQTPQTALNRLSQDSALKRKRSDSIASSDDQQRKKVKVKSEPLEAPRLSRTPSQEVADPVGAALDIWWKAMETNQMIGGGMPSLYQPERLLDSPLVVKEKGIGTGKRKRVAENSQKADSQRARKKARHDKPREQTQTMLTLMNSNISTLHRLRTAHDKYGRLVAENKDGAGEPGDSQTTVTGATQSQGSVDSHHTFDSEATTLVEEPIERKRARERPWKVRGEVGAEEARDCVHWMCSKVLEHSTFQGTSSLALQSLCDIALTYISNIGNTLHLLMDKYSRRMSSEEIILHTLFENGVTSVSDLEYYIKDDIVRHGTRLQEMEKKMNSALDEVIKADVLDDDAVFGEDADEDNFASGMFGDLLGEDYLGFEASGVLSEFGLGNFSIPKRLWKGKKNGNTDASASGEKGEPPLPYPPPPPFVPLRSDQIDNQIGLLQDYYRNRFSALIHPPTAKESGFTMNSTTPIPTIAVLPPPTTSSTSPPPVSTTPTPSLLAPPGAHAPLSSLSSGEDPLILPDDVLDPTHTKIGPIGQIIVPSVNATSGSKKKSAAKKDIPVSDQGDGSPAKGKGGGSKKPAAKGQDKEGSKDVRLGSPSTTNGSGTPSPKKKKVSLNGTGQTGNGTPPPTTKKGTPIKATKNNSPSASKGPTNGGANGNGPVLIPPV